MPEDNLGVAQRAALLALMLEGREVSNPELKERRKLTIVGLDRRRLNELKLVESRQEGRSFRHELTERGWKWCFVEFHAEPPARAGSLERGLYGVLSAVVRLVDREQLALTDAFTPEAEEADLEARIREVYRDLADEPKAWVSLTDLRPRLGDAPRTEVDEVLRRMDGTPKVTIIPEANQRTLTPEDRAAAVRIGDEENHLISIGEA
jgi:hypothetical protein